MKKLLTLLFCLSASWASAQAVGDTIKLPVSADTHLVTYSEVVQAPGVSQSELYSRAKLWFASTFKSAKDVVQADEKEAGVVQGTGWSTTYVKSLGIPSPQKLWYTVKIAVKDGRYKYDISSFQIENEAGQYNRNPTPYPVERALLAEKSKGMVGKILGQQRQNVKDAALTLASTIKEGMNKPAAGTAGGKEW
jgi:hypothetical protein